MRRLAFALGATLALAGPVQAAMLVGAARIPAAARDGTGETLGGFGSGMALVPGSLKRTRNGVSGTLAMVPDRGWNTQGSGDYRARVQMFDFSLHPQAGAPHAQTGLDLRLRRTLLPTDDEGAPTTGLDPNGVRAGEKNIPDLPAASNGRVSLDNEAVALPGDGSFWVSDEYGPLIYHYDAGGRMTGAMRPPEAIIPHRGGKENCPPARASRASPSPAARTIRASRA